MSNNCNAGPDILLSDQKDKLFDIISTLAPFSVLKLFDDNGCQTVGRERGKVDGVKEVKYVITDLWVVNILCNIYMPNC